MSKARKTAHRSNNRIDIARSDASGVSRCKVASDISRYSRPEPQILPFPPELVVRILGYLDRACDKKNARLVCKGFAAAGLSSLTSTVYFSNSLIGIDFSSKDAHLTSPTLEIAMHPVVSKYITTLVCEGTPLSKPHQNVVDFQNWWALLCKPQTLWPVDMIYNLYSTRYASEAWMIKNREDQKIFYTALEKFPKLDCMVIRDVISSWGQDWPRPTWPDAAPRGDPWHTSSPYHSFAVCIRSLSKMGIKLRELHIVGSENAISNQIFSSASPKDYNHLLNVFAPLCNVAVNVNTHHDTWPLTFPGLGRILTHATQLQSLDLKSHSTNVRQSYLNLPQVFQNVTWPNLKHFGLSGFKLWTDVGLIAFFHRHRATVDSVSLRFMFLHHKDPSSTDDTPCEAWAHFFGELRGLKISFRVLELFRIHDCYNSERGAMELHTRAAGGISVLRYLRLGGPNPLQLPSARKNDAQ